MNAELRKMLNEAADNFIGHPYEIEEGLDITIERKAFKKGAELGYKEAITQAKKWLKENGYLATNGWYTIKGTLADFEADMNKLLEK